MCCTDPAQSLTTEDEEWNDLDHDVPELFYLPKESVRRTSR